MAGSMIPRRSQKQAAPGFWKARGTACCGSGTTRCWTTPRVCARPSPKISTRSFPLVLSRAPPPVLSRAPPPRPSPIEGEGGKQERRTILPIPNKRSRNSNRSSTRAAPNWPRATATSRSRSNYQTATSDVLRAMSASPGDPQPVFDLIVRRARDLCNTATATLFEFDGELVHFRSVVRDESYGTPDTSKAYERLFPMVPTRGSITCRAILDRQTIHIRDKDAEAGLAQTIRDLSWKSNLAIPLLRDGVAIGAISLTAEGIGGFSDSQVALAQTFAEQAVIAITSAETYRELQARTRDLEESLEYQTATSDVLNVISRSTSDVQPVLDTVAETAARLCGADIGTILIREGDVYRYVANNYASISAADAEFWAALRQRTMVPGRDSVAGRVALEGRVVQIADISVDPDYAPEVVAAGRRTMLGVPLLRDSELIGVINLSRKRVEPFTERQIELVRTFADQAVIAMENARLLGELQARTRDLE